MNMKRRPPSTDAETICTVCRRPIVWSLEERAWRHSAPLSRPMRTCAPICDVEGCEDDAHVALGHSGVDGGGQPRFYPRFWVCTAHSLDAQHEGRGLIERC